MFGHHFTSIAGTGPIVGPALAIIWGWVPALLWVAVLLAYCYAASVLPVWLLLQPREYINIACVAASGFHCLVSSGTSSKQLRCEPDAQFVGCGAMLLEGFLAVLVFERPGAAAPNSIR